MRKYKVSVTDITDSETGVEVMDYIVNVPSGRIADALKFGTLDGMRELDALPEEDQPHDP